MANEITITTGMKVVNGGLTFAVTTASIQADQTTARGGGPGTVDVGTIEETLSFGDITPGYTHFKNLDATNFIEMGNATGSYLVKLPPGGVATFYVNDSETIYVKADTSTCKLQVVSANQ